MLDSFDLLYNKRYNKSIRNRGNCVCAIARRESAAVDGACAATNAPTAAVAAAVSRRALWTNRAL